MRYRALVLMAVVTLILTAVCLILQADLAEIIWIIVLTNIWAFVGFNILGEFDFPQKTKPREQTKIVLRPCHDCKRTVSVLCNASAQILSVRCPECQEAFIDRNEAACEQQKVPSMGTGKKENANDESNFKKVE